MICSHCKTAGQYNSQARQLGSDRENIGAMALYEFARQEHSKCSGGTYCDCQHVTGDGTLNRDRIAESSRWLDG